MRVLVVGLLLMMTGCVSTSVSVTSSEPLVVKGLKGTYSYTEEPYRGTTIWTREDPNDLYRKHPNAWKKKLKPENTRSGEISKILNDIRPERMGSRRPLKTDQEIWDQVRATWSWCVEHMRQDSVALRKLVEENPEGPSLHDHARVWMTKGYLPTGTCGSVSHLFLQLAYEGGVPTDRLAMAQCVYPFSASPIGTASHAYVILWVNDAWYFLDPNARMTNKLLPQRVEDVRSAGFPEDMGFEYRWPFDTVFYQPHPFGGRLPLVSE